MFLFLFVNEISIPLSKKSCKVYIDRKTALLILNYYFNEKT